MTAALSLLKRRVQKVCTECSQVAELTDGLCEYCRERLAAEQRIDDELNDPRRGLAAEINRRSIW